MRAVVLFDDQYIFSYTGFVFSPTERPIAAVLAPDGELLLFLPGVEREYAQQTGDADRVFDYREYPGRRHPKSWPPGSLTRDA